MQQFKVGDWVRLPEGAIGKIDVILLAGAIVRLTPTPEEDSWYATEWELWQPEEGDFCWFRCSSWHSPVFGKFVTLNNDNTYRAELNDGKGNIFYDDFSYCEPFVDKLP
jgi:hypothetical protein